MDRHTILLSVILMLTVGVAIVKSAVDEEPVFFMVFDEGSGNVVHDASGNGNHGRIVGTPIWKPDKIGSYLYLDGSTYITVPNAEPLSELTHPMTVGAWVNPDFLGGTWHNIVEMDGPAGWKFGFFNARVVWTTYSVQDFISQTPIPTDKWTHIAASWDGQEAIIYINGSPEPPIQGGGVIDVGDLPSLDIGHRRTSGVLFYIGSLDDLLIYDRVLNQQEIEEIRLTGVKSEMMRRLSITSAVAPPEGSVNIQLTVSDATGITGGDILIRYDSSVVAVDQLKATSLLSGMSFIANTDILGQIKIAIASADSIPSGSGAMVDIELTINTNARAGTNTVLELDDSTMLYNESGAEVPISLMNGIITVAGTKGDVNGDGAIKSNDAINALQIAAGKLIPTGYQKWAADMSNDGRINSADAILILRKATGKEAPAIGPIASARPITIALDRIQSTSGGNVTIPIRIDSADALAAGDILIAYDNSSLRAVEVAAPSDVMMADNIDVPGLVCISFAVMDSLHDNTIATITFDILSDNPVQPALQTVELYDRDARPIVVRLHYPALVPENTAIFQNYPNPFNPETWIPYQLAEDSEVTIRIYDSAGRLIRTLDLGRKTIGLYITRDAAAYWDGKTNTGEYVSSGVFFYTIQVREFTATRKMAVEK